MARYTGPRDKISRRFGVPVFGPSKYLERKNYPPGTHGPRARRKYTDYALALMEKQKLRFHYGLMEKQFRSIYEKAHRHRGVTGEIMLQLLECRLDNVIYRLGFGATRAQARQMVSHGHVVVNGAKMTSDDTLMMLDARCELMLDVTYKTLESDPELRLCEGLRLIEATREAMVRMAPASLEIFDSRVLPRLRSVLMERFGLSELPPGPVN